MDDLEFQVRPGRIADRGARSRTFVGDALRAAARAGAPRGHFVGVAGRRSRGGQIRPPTGLSPHTRRVVVKARVVRHAGARFRAAPLAMHIRYLKRDGVDRDGAPGRMFGREGETDEHAFAARCAGDRHHFRFIVSPEDAGQMADLRAFARDLMAQAETDLGTRLDWVAVAHWNTAHPHLHVLVRGVDAKGADLVIPRDYIGQSLRRRAEALVSLELGPRSAREIAAGLDREVNAEGWTRLDATLDRLASDARVDLRPRAPDLPADLRPALLGRAQVLTRWGLAEPAGAGVWRLLPDRRRIQEALAQRAEVVGRLRRVGPRRAAEDFVVAGERDPVPVVGRLAARGLHDELTGEAFVIVDGLDGRLRHVRVPDLAAAGDTPLGGLVALQPEGGAMRVFHRSDLTLQAQVAAPGATWLDRQLVAAEPHPLAPTGFGAEARAALAARGAQLLAAGLGREGAAGPRFAAGLLQTLRARELSDAGARLAAETGRPVETAEAGDVRGRYVRRLDLASGRFVVLEDGLGFRLAPWAQALERRLGQEVTGRMTGGRMAWDLGRSRGRER